MTTPKAKGLSGIKLNPFDKVRKRPAAYIGTVKNVKEEQWVFDDETQTIVKKVIEYNTGIKHLFVEIMSNAIDNMWRSTEQGYTQTKIEVTIDSDPTSEEFGWITILNDGYPIPVDLREYSLTNYRTGETTTERAYPADYFWGEFDSGTNYEEDARRKSSGLHGIGGKIVTALSSQVIIEHADPNNRKKYYKLYEDGGKVQHEPKVTSYSNKNGYTSVSFLPDFEYFEVEGGITEDFFGLLKRYVYEAAMITGLKVSLNGERAVVDNLKKYARFFYPDEKENKLIHFLAPNGDECVIISGDIPETNSQPSPNQVSWVNGVNTSTGGLHVDAWATLIFGKLVKAFNTKKRPKGTPEIKVSARQLYPWLMMYVRAETFGAVFDSNEKKQLTGVTDPTGLVMDKIVLNDPKSAEFIKSVDQAVEKIMKWDFISIIEEQLIAQADGVLLKDTNKNSPKKFYSDKYEDANQVLEEPENCVLLICEGKSAHTMARRLRSYLPGQQDYWGIFELRGKFVNLCKSPRKALKNEEFLMLKKMAGLTLMTDYSTPKSRKSLRYGGLWLLTDADTDGFHIRGLLASSLNKFWPSVITQDPTESLLSDVSTFVVIVTVKDKFYKGYNSKYEFDSDTEPLPKGAQVRYLKGIGAHRPNDTASYADDLRVRRYFKDSQGTEFIHMAFEASPDSRKKWILETMNNVINGTPIPISKAKGNLALSSLVKSDIAPFFIETLSRALPSIWDGQKESQRKCLFGIENMKITSSGVKSMIAVVGEIKEIAGYHKGELYETVARMTQSFAGSNNINYFIPDGECGTRAFNGTDISKDRYLSTGPEKILEAIFSPMDRPLLERVLADDQIHKYEYTHYVPVVPMVLINGAEGIATGWSTKIPCYRPSDVVAKIRLWLAGEPLGARLVPWFRNFKGEIYLTTRTKAGKPKRWNDPALGGDSDPEVVPNSWTAKGTLVKADTPWSSTVKEKGWIIDEIPIGVSISSVLDHVNFLLTGVKQMKKKKFASDTSAKSAKSKGQITAKVKPKLRDLKDYSLPNYPNIQILPTKAFIPDMDTKGNFDFLIQTHSLNNMILLNTQGIPTKYQSAEDILLEWCEARYEIYSQRREYWIKRWARDLIRQQQRYNFVSYVIDGSLDMHQGDEELEEAMLEIGLVKLVPEAKFDESEGGGEGSQSDKANFEYLLSMQMRSMTARKLEEIKKELEKIQANLEDYQSSTEAELWERDLQTFEASHEKHEKTLEDRDLHEAAHSKRKRKGKAKAKGKAKKQ